MTEIKKEIEKPKKKIPNPTGKGGFRDHPELINAGGRPKNSQRYDYWLQFFKDMDVETFKKYSKSKSEKEMFVAEAQAYARIAESLKNVKTWIMVADRTEGKASQSVDVTSQGERLHMEPVIISEIASRNAES